MNDSILKLEASVKKWMIAIVDVILFSVCNVAIAYIANNGRLDFYGNVIVNPLHFFLISVIVIIVNYLFSLYKSVWAFAGIKEVISCCGAAFINSLLLYGVDKILFKIIFKMQILSDFLYIFNIILVTFALCAPRIGYRVLRYELRGNSLFHGKSSGKRVLLVGAGYMGNTVLNTLITNQWKKYRVVAFVDDNISKQGKKVNGVKVIGTCNDIPQIVEEYNIDEVIICIPSATKSRINEIYSIATSTGKIVKTTPSLEEIIEDNQAMSKLRKVEISDLLARDEIKLDIKVCRYLIGKTILVTGGGGSIGSEICNQCARYKPETIVIFDIYENCAFELANDLANKYAGKINIEVRIGSVRDKNRLDEVFEEFHPDVVFHAAAHKHVPLMEASPCEAVKNNIFGTYNVAIAADKFKVPKMVILSTDKAVNPTNVMGATKRVTEIIVQYMDSISTNTEYAAVRFGNVLGSHGSVIPIFEKQIANGGPVTVTHPDITRYFMTIPEAAQLVCQAGGLARGGEIFVLDMGEPVKIMELAKNMIHLSGYTIDEIGIEITGLRPGEKLYEELAMDTEMETREKTANEKIFVNKPMVFDEKQFEKMLLSLENINEDNVREKLMAIVPNYCPAKNE